MSEKVPKAPAPVEEVPKAPTEGEVPDWFKNLNQTDVEPEAPTDPHAAAAPEPLAPPEPPVAPGGDGGPGGELPEVPKAPVAEVFVDADQAARAAAAKPAEAPEAKISATSIGDLTVEIPDQGRPGEPVHVVAEPLAAEALPSAPEAIKPPEPKKARYEDDLLRAISSSKDGVAANIEELTSALGVSSLEPEEQRLLKTAIRAQGDLVGVDLSKVETQAGLRQVKLAEKETQLNRITGLEVKINALGLESTRQEAIKAAEHQAGLQTIGDSLQRELDGIKTGIGELQADMAAATSERGKASLARDLADLENKRTTVGFSLDQHKPQLAAAERQAEEAQTRLVCIEKAVARFEADMTEPRALLATIEDELAKFGQVSAETQQKVEDLREQMGQKETQLQIDGVLKDMEGLGEAMDGLDPRFVHRGGLQTDAMKALSAQFASPQLVDIHWVTRLETENRGVVGEIGLGGVLKQRAEQMTWLYQLAQSGSPEEMMQRLVDSGRVSLPETFRQAARSVLETGKMPEVPVEGLPRELAEALEKRNELYLAVLNKFGVETAEQKSSREAREKYEAEKMKVAEGVAESIQAGKEAKQAEARAEAEEKQRQRLAQEAAEKQRQDKQRLLQEEAERARQRVAELEPVAGEAQGQVTLALEAAVRDLGAVVMPDGLKAPLVTGETLASRLAAIEAWKKDELENQLKDTKRKVGVDPETDKAGDGKEHEKSVKRVDDILTKFQAGEANDKAIQNTLNELRRVPGIGSAMAEVFSKMVSRLQANRGSLSDNDITESIGKDSNLRKLLGVPELAGIGAGAVAGMLPLFEGMFNTALASMGLAGR